MLEYVYGMRERPFSIGCQPMEGLDRCEPNDRYEKGADGYWDRLVYRRKLSEEECFQYDLDFLEERNAT